MNMNTSEVLDLSKENIQPLKQGRNAAKLGTALQAQTNAELHQKLLAEREEFELLIRMYEGDDPLKPHYDYVRWIEQSFPKHGPESNLVQILENTLTAFKDDERYKQDVRYAELLIKYIDTQPNPVEIYQLVYNQGLCTMCAPFYKAWADELDKHNDVKNADQVYELGIRVNAQPLELLKEAHLRFQLSVGRRMLGRQDECDEEELEYNRQALHKLHKQNVYSVRDPKGAPGQVKQQTLGSRNSQSSGAPFKVYQGEDNDYNAGESQGKMFPKQKLVNKENALKAGPWTQHGGKHRSRVTGPITPTPTFQVHEDEGADVGSGTHKTPSVPRALKPRKIDNFTCPLAVFEPPDPTKKPMYCKSKVYAGGREFQFEELRAALYNRRYEQLEAMRIQQEIQNEANAKQHQEDHITDEDNVSIPKKDVDVPTSSEKDDKYDDMTCNTKAFDFVLPSSTPLVGHLKSANNHQASKQNINGSYIAEDVKKCGTNTKQELSMIFEASKERYSSSSGSSGSKTQASVCTAANTSLAPGQAQAELMEKLAQISANKSLEELEKSVGLLNISGPVDPFCTELISQLLSHIGYPKKHHLIGLHRFENDAPILNCNSTVKLGNTKYSLIGELGKGSYARVLKATRDGQPVALKQQRPAWEWEWYIVQELQSRLPPNKMGGYLHMSNGYVYKNGSILESEWAQYGSILSVVSKLKIAGKGHDLHLAMLFSIQMISIVEHLHNCKIIHGDIKPDNFVLCSVPSADVTVPCLKLIDFGRSIDMTLFPEGTTFTKVVTTDGFQCNEMKEGRPWTYQTDLYGLAGSIYSVLFYDYMKVVKKDKKWQLSNKIPRYMMPAVWQDVFTPLLNVESCENIPDLSALREILEQPYRSMDLSTVNQSINKLRNILLNK
uniref:Protein kinase domain-containing protein n=1 Tax=Cuerna arida TaxID=1464854 RepID=A0A1B6F5J3_9HEMI